jgi:PAS domain S-box-containing protein
MFSFKIKSFKKSEKKILIGLLSILIILVTITFLTHRNSKRVVASAEQVDRSQEIKYHIEQTLAEIISIETAARGYVITGDVEYLKPNGDATADIYAHLSNLRLMVQDDSLLASRVEELSDMIEEQIDISRNIIFARTSSGFDEAIKMVKTGEGKILMDQIRTLTVSLLKSEDQKLLEEKDESRSSIRNFNWSFDGLVLKIAISILTVFFVLRFYFRMRRNAEEQLKENKELLQRIIDNTTAVIFIKDLEGRYMLINSRYEKLFCVSQDQVKGKTDYDFFPKEIADAVRLADMEVIRNNKLIEFEENVPSEGMMRNYISIKFPLHDENNKPYAVCGMATDITERKEIENLLRLRNHEILDLFNNAPCGYHSINKDGTIIEMNQTELNWLGYSRDEIVNSKNVRDLINFESAIIFNTLFPEVIAGRTEAIHSIQITMKRKNGTEFPVELNVITVYDEDGNFHHARSSVFDVTHRRQADAIIFQN